MKKTIVFVSLFLSLIFVASQPIFAGGGLVYFEKVTSSNEDFNNFRIPTVHPGEKFFVTAQIHLPNDDSYDSTIRWCQNCPVKIKLENPVSSDEIMQNSPTTNNEGRVEATIISHISGQRQVYAEVLLPESNFTRDNGNPYPYSSRSVLNYGGPTVTPVIVNTGTIATPPVLPTVNPGIVRPTPAVTPISSPIGMPVVVPDTNKNLEEKVNNLEKQLEESKQRQSILEQRLNSLMSWIKSFFHSSDTEVLGK